MKAYELTCKNLWTSPSLEKNSIFNISKILIRYMYIQCTHVSTVFLVKHILSYWDTGFKLATLVVIDTDCTGSCKSNYHTITTTFIINNITNIQSIYFLKLFGGMECKGPLVRNCKYSSPPVQEKSHRWCNV